MLDSSHGAWDDGPIGRIRIPRPAQNVRVPDYILNCVGYIAEPVSSGAIEDSYDPVGTCFFIGIPSLVSPPQVYYVLVTALHVIEGLAGRPFVVIANKRGGGVTILRLTGKEGFMHATDESVDAVIILFNRAPDVDIAHLPPSMLLTPSMMADHRIGIGDEVFMPGLFSHAPGIQRTMPLLRYGNIAMLPDHQIQVENYYADVYLVEARSIGGMSGSPVFVRKTVSIKLQDASGSQYTQLGVGDHYLLGLAHGHWDIKESDINKPGLIQNRQHGVNMGIAVIVPAYKILEILDNPTFKALMEENEQRLRRAITPGPDAV